MSRRHDRFQEQLGYGDEESWSCGLWRQASHRDMARVDPGLFSRVNMQTVFRLRGVSDAKIQAQVEVFDAAEAG